jgi:hypothetical protein
MNPKNLQPKVRMTLEGIEVDFLGGPVKAKYLPNGDLEVASTPKGGA